MARTKVFYLITGLHIGGAEKAFLELMKCLDRARFEPIVGALVGGELIPEFERLGVRVYDFRMRHRLDLRALLRLRRALRAERPDILHTRLIRADWAGRLVGRACRVPVIVSTVPMVEDARRRWPWNAVDRWTARTNQAIIALSDYVKQELIRVEKLDPEKFHVIPNGVVDEGWQEVGQDRRIRELLGVPPGTRLAGVVSRLEAPRKGHHIFLDAMARLAARYPDVHGVLIGDGPGRAALEQRARALGLAGRITFAGTQRDVKAWLAALDLFVLPSLHEGFPMAIVEAMAAGRPIIATAVAGVPDLVVDGETGRLVPPGDAVALAAALEKLLDDPVCARRFGAAARRRYEERFEMRQVACRIEALYEQLLRTHPDTSVGSGREALAPSPQPPAPSQDSVQSVSRARRREDCRIKLLEVVTSFDAGGVTTYLAHLIRGLPRDRFEILLAAGPDDFQGAVAAELGVRCHQMPLTKPISPCKDLAALWQLCRLIRRERVDIVHTHMAKGDALGGLAARLCGVAGIVSTAHGPLRLTPGRSLIQSFFDGIERLVYRTLPDRVISVSSATTAELLRKRKVQPDQAATISNGIEPAAAPRQAARRRVRKQLGLAERQPVIVTVGRLTAPKTPAVLIESVARLIADWPDLVCLIIGDGHQRDTLAALVRAHGLERSVKFLGCRGDVRDLLAAADLFVLATYSEGMPYSVLEAMAEGLPVVTARLEGMDELVEHGATGWLVPGNDAAGYARAIDALLRDPAARRTMGLAARERIQTRHSLARQLDATQQVLVSAIGRRDLKEFRAPSAFQRLRLYAREEGARKAMQRVIGLCLRPWYRDERLWFLTRPVADPVRRLRLHSSCRIRVATPEDVGKLAALGFDRQADLSRLLRSSCDACFIAEKDGGVVAFQWVALGPRGLWIDPLERSIQLAERQAHLVRCRALRAFRGKGVIPAIEAEVFGWLAARGYDLVSTDIGADHTLSLSTFEKLGFMKTIRVRLRRWGPFARWDCHQPWLREDPRRDTERWRQRFQHVVQMSTKRHTIPPISEAFRTLAAPDLVPVPAASWSDPHAHPTL